MADYQVSYNAATKLAIIQAKGDAPPAGSTKLGEFKHDDVQDGLGASNTNVAYTTSNPARATVSATGLVTGVATGAAATITATTDDGSFTATAAITVS